MQTDVRPIKHDGSLRLAESTGRGRSAPGRAVRDARRRGLRGGRVDARRPAGARGCGSAVSAPRRQVSRGLMNGMGAASPLRYHRVVELRRTRREIAESFLRALVPVALLRELRGREALAAAA